MYQCNIFLNFITNPWKDELIKIHLQSPCPTYEYRVHL